MLATVWWEAAVLFGAFVGGVVLLVAVFVWVAGANAYHHVGDEWTPEQLNRDESGQR